ncbi:hypothetical protein [Exilibacterium tricleocarpae]|nr:hypothetical protein [Exilibacterium tricleocarpae]
MLSALSAGELAQWLDPEGDVDGDGVSNADELVNYADELEAPL